MHKARANLYTQFNNAYRYGKAAYSVYKGARGIFGGVRKSPRSPRGPFGAVLRYPKRGKFKHTQVVPGHGAMAASGHANIIYHNNYQSRHVGKHVYAKLGDANKHIAYERNNYVWESGYGLQQIYDVGSVTGPQLRAIVATNITDVADYFENYCYIFSINQVHQFTNNTNATAEIKLEHFRCIKNTNDTVSTKVKAGEDNMGGGTATQYSLFDDNIHDTKLVSASWKTSGKRHMWLGPGETVRWTTTIHVNKKLNLDYFQSYSTTYLANLSVQTLLTVRGGQIVSFNNAAGAHVASTNSVIKLHGIFESRSYSKCFPRPETPASAFTSSGVLPLIADVPVGGAIVLVTEDTDLIATPAVAGT